MNSATTRRSIVDLWRDIANGLSPVMVVEDCLERISAQDSAINAMIFVDQDAALDAAHRAEREIRAGRHLGPLHGVPVAVKDMIDVAGWPTTAGSQLFGDYEAEADAACVANLKAAGAIVLGKTNLHELTVGSHDNPWFGKVVNPRDSSRGTAGTSSGSAAAVAAGLCVAAVGTDTGGSNRSTAATTGLFGFKPTNGLIDSRGVRPTAPSLDAIGPITLNVADAMLMTAAMCGGRPGLIQAALPVPVDISTLALGVCPDLYASAVDPAVEQALAAWTDGLRRAGARTVELPFDAAEAFTQAGLTILKYEFASEYSRLIEQRPTSVGHTVLSFLGDALLVDKSSYAQALSVRLRAKQAFFQAMSGVDALLLPTSPGLAPRLSDEYTQVGDSEVPYGLAGGRFRRWANMFGMPALAMPIATAGDLPASVQLAALPGCETALFGIAAALACSTDGGCSRFS